VTDSKRLQQVLKNLLSNAFKFTAEGGVRMTVSAALGGWSAEHPLLNHAAVVVAFEVSDTGIGIPLDKQKLIFEAFQQADAGTSRKYGGTGLGLAISREIARLLGGEIRLASAFGQGSTFTLFLPQTHVPMRTVRKDSGITRALTRVTDDRPELTEIEPLELQEVPDETTIEDDRGKIHQGDKVLLIVEDDPNYGRVLLEMAHEKGFKAVIAQRGTEALALVRELKPAAVTLDVHLPDLDGWRVLDGLKIDLATRHIPVHIISVDDDPEPMRTAAAVGYLTKTETKESLEFAFEHLKNFVERPVKNLLLVEDDEIQTMSIRELIGNGDVKTTVVGTGQEALKAIETQRYDCMVLDLGLPDMTGTELLERVKNSPNRSMPIIVYTARELLQEESARLKRLAEKILIKDVRSPERLLDETALFLHRNVSKLPDRQRKMVESLHKGALEGKKALIVDDDIRNIFAMTSVLERFKMKVVSAENGKDGIQTLLDAPDIDIVLMDIMLPVMDGYTTIRAIREIEQFKDMPIVAVTAKAMKGDREKCLAAGASDYICKPVEAEQLRSVLRLWLPK
jgi:CheY-like chemotaxis protein